MRLFFLAVVVALSASMSIAVRAIVVNQMILSEDFPSVRRVVIELAARAAHYDTKAQGDTRARVMMKVKKGAIKMKIKRNNITACTTRLAGKRNLEERWDLDSSFVTLFLVSKGVQGCLEGAAVAGDHNECQRFWPSASRLRHVLLDKNEY
ncbi:hypothetical protein BDR06DRAFT_1000737 [Suillus hirtellus]|nr:hypothetical protein BDR06DRAFT_1000737 [Suillus hirtellus]